MGCKIWVTSQHLSTPWWRETRREYTVSPKTTAKWPLNDRHLTLALQCCTLLLWCNCNKACSLYEFSGQDNDHSSYDLHFSRQIFTDRVKSVTLTPTQLSNFTASLWIKTSVKSPLIVFVIGKLGNRFFLELESTGSLSLCGSGYNYTCK